MTNSDGFWKAKGPKIDTKEFKLNCKGGLGGQINELTGFLSGQIGGVLAGRGAQNRYLGIQVKL